MGDGLTVIEKELEGERASSLGEAGKRLEAALIALGRRQMVDTPHGLGERAIRVVQRVALRGEIAEAHQMRDRASEVARSRVVAPELIGDLVEPLPMQLLERLADGRVQDRAARWEQAVVGDATDPVVAEVEPIADGVEDLQVSLLIDTDGNGAIGAETGTASDEYIYNNTGDTLPTGQTYRAVRVSLVARSVGQLVGAGTVSTRPALEDRTAGTADNYRRRVLRSTVEIRNGGSSP